MTWRVLASAAFVACAFAAWPLLGKQSRVTGAWMSVAVMAGSTLTVTLLSLTRLASLPALGHRWWWLGGAAAANGLAVYVYASRAADPLVPTAAFLVTVAVLQIAAIPLLTWLLPGGTLPSPRQSVGFILAAVAVYLLARG
jgi:hypothetical protein